MDIESFIARWSGRTGGAERANYQLFLVELCDVLGVPHPDPASAETRFNDYVFERAVRPRAVDGGGAPKRIDLYKRGSFILEAKQSRLPGGEKALPGPSAPERPRGWDVMMQNARRQAEGYVFLLETSHAAPPFLLVLDVGHVLEIYADFTGTGRGYDQFPDRNSFRIALPALRDSVVRERLKRIWTDPLSLDPSREAARVTRAVAARLAVVSRHLEAEHPPEAVARFLMRCIFTMFAEDVGLLPQNSFSKLLADCMAAPENFVPMVEELWRKMDAPRSDDRFYSAFQTRLRHFNGNLFRDADAFALPAAELGELLAAATVRWTDVDPAIFGTLLEQALDPRERRRLGAHYTPRAYVERLVKVAVMEPLHADWQAALTRAQAASDAGKPKDHVIAIVRGFHARLCATRVLDPACGTGNFLYVALELMKKLEGEVLETLKELGQTDMLALEGGTVDPHQFLGLEVNPRAASIAELVVWIGFLQQHYRTQTGHPAEPILKAFRTINGGSGAGFDAVLAHDGPDETGAYRAPRRPDWPPAEFIVGNPPFIGGKDLRSRLGAPAVAALWQAHRHMNESADFVMYWWDRAAELLMREKTPLRRFGFVTTNSIRQVFQRRTIERHLAAGVSLVFAIPDHPWTKATRDAAAVRIAMTVAERGSRDGAIWQVTEESGLDTDEPHIAYVRQDGRINADLTIGTNAAGASALMANDLLCSPGVKLHGAGFIVSDAEAEMLGLGSRPGLDEHIREYRNGKDLTARSRGKKVIDLFGLTQDEVRRRFPEVYQHLGDTVRADRQTQLSKSATKDSEDYVRRWWEFGKPRSELRSALEGLPRYIATVETAKHRVFQFLDAGILPDNMLVAIASDDAAHLAVLSSRIHGLWCSAHGGSLEDRPRYTKSRCFDPFPFPVLETRSAETLRATAEEFDETRKRVLADNPDLTLTGLYNLLEKERAGARLTPAETDMRRRGRIAILRELHETIDRLVLQAYGWPENIAEAEIMAGLVALNADRARDEAHGDVRWLRPAFQRPRLERVPTLRDLEPAAAIALGAPIALPPFPADPLDQPLAIERLLASSGRAMTLAEIAAGFSRARNLERRTERALQTLLRYGHVADLGNGRVAVADRSGLPRAV